MNTQLLSDAPPSPVAALTRLDEQDTALGNFASAVVQEESRFGATVGDIGILVPAGELAEVVEQQRVCRLPNAPPWLDGLINLRGNLVPVLNLHRLIDAQPRNGGVRRLLVLGHGDHAIALFVDVLPRAVDDLKTPVSTPPLPAALAEFVLGAYVSRGEVWLTLDLPRLAHALCDAAS